MSRFLFHPLARRLAVGWSALLILLLVAGRASAQAPGWAVDLTAYEHTETITASVLIDGALAADPRTELGAFVGASLRGAARPFALGGGSSLFFLTLGSNVGSGELVTFQVYDPATGFVQPLRETITFTSGAALGDPTAPVVLSTASGDGPGPLWTAPDAAGFEHLMTATGTVELDGRPARHPADRIGAFVGADCRGIGRPILVGDRALFFLSVYSAGRSGETVRFEFYDGATGRTLPLPETLPFSGGEAVGDPTMPYRWTGGAARTGPGWTVDPAAFEATMTVTAALDPAADPPGSNDRLGAFVGGICRGVATATAFGGGRRFFLTVAGQPTETITFRLYRADRDGVEPISDTIPFATDAVLGSPTAPIVLHPSGALDGFPALRPLPDQRTELGTAFPTLDLAPYLVERDGNAILFGVAGGSSLVGSISGSVLTVTATGGFVGSETLTIRATDATAAGLSSSTTIKYTVYPLDTAPVIGQIPDQRIGPTGTFHPIDLSAFLSEGDGQPVEWSYTVTSATSNEIGTASPTVPVWTVNPTAFELSQTVTATLELPDGMTFSPTDRLAAFVGGAIRGVAAPQFADGKWTYFMLISGNTAGEAVTFRTYAAGRILPVVETTTFSPDGILGSRATPLGLHVAGLQLGLTSGGGMVSPSLVDPLWVGQVTVTFTATNQGTDAHRTGSTSVTFVRTAGLSPLLGTLTVSAVTSSSATVAGSVNPNGLPTDVWLRRGPVGGAATDSVQLATGLTSATTVPLNTLLTGLNPATAYQLDLAATSDGGRVTTPTVTFTTLSDCPAGFTCFPTPIGAGNFGLTGIVAVTIAGGDGVGQFAYRLMTDEPTGVRPAGILGWWPQTVTVSGLDGAGYTTVTLRFSLSGIGGITDPSVLRILKRSTATDPWTIMDGQNGHPATVLIDAQTLEVTVTSLSDFAIGTTNLGDAPLAVNLNGFSGSVTAQNTIRLNWATSTERDNVGFIVLRDGAAIADYTGVAALRGAGTSTTARTYAYTDARVEQGRRYVYTLRTVNQLGAVHDLPESVTIDLAPTTAPPTAFRLLPASPNPFNPTTAIRYQLSAVSQVQLDVFDALGRKVRVLVDETKPAGSYTATFDAAGLPSGVYVIRMTATGPSERFNATERVLLAK